MPDIVFQVDIAADRATVARAVASQDGIRGWWTAAADVPAEVGGVMRLGFQKAPAPFELRIDEQNEARVRWAHVGGMPPHWANTTMEWRFTAVPDGPGTRVDFRHAHWPTDDGGFGASAFTWGTLMVSLKAYVETGATAGRLPS